jgi:predicted DNA-binding WGR domain protein
MDRATDHDFGLATVQLRRIRPEKNERRFYAMTATFDLFGEAILVRNWGRIGTGGRLRRDVCPYRSSSFDGMNQTFHGNLNLAGVEAGTTWVSNIPSAQRCLRSTPHAVQGPRRRRFQKGCRRE